jgi:hypothetical protein
MFEKLEAVRDRLKQKPIQTLIFVIFAGLMVVTVSFLSGISEQAASALSKAVLSDKIIITRTFPEKTAAGEYYLDVRLVNYSENEEWIDEIIVSKHGFVGLMSSRPFDEVIDTDMDVCDGSNRNGPYSDVRGKLNLVVPPRSAYRLRVNLTCSTPDTAKCAVIRTSFATSTGLVLGNEVCVPL